MKRTVFTILAVFITLFVEAISYAKSVDSEGAVSSSNEVDSSLAPASKLDDYSRDLGIYFGAGYMLKSIDENLQARFDLPSYRFNNDFTWGTGSYTRIPMVVSARYYVPIVDKVRAFGQAGLETSVDLDSSAHQKESLANLGLAPGAGIEYFVNPKVGVYALGVEHLISDSYFSMQFGVASHF
jgi:hypothetical protein